MISDNDLYRLAIFLGCSSVLLIVLYHFLDINAKQDEKSTEAPPTAAPQGQKHGSSGSK